MPSIKASVKQIITVVPVMTSAKIDADFSRIRILKYSTRFLHTAELLQTIL